MANAKKNSTGKSRPRLTDKQQRFVDEYLVDMNATQAAIRAGYSQKTARAIAQENLTKPDIQQAIQIRRLELKQKTEITQERIVAELAAIGLAPAADFEDTALAAGALFRGSSKLKALELLGKYLGLFEECKNHGGEVVQIVDDIPKR